MGAPKHFFFDLDQTLTESRSVIRDDHMELLKDLSDMYDVVIVSGAQRSQMEKQLPALAEQSGMYVLAQNGNDAYGKYHLHKESGESYEQHLWHNTLSWVEKFRVFKYIEDIITDGLKFKNLDDLVEDRGCQISFSLVGHHMPLGMKAAFDPDREKRRALLQKIPFHSDNLEVRIGGTTCLDFFKRGAHKGNNCRLLTELEHWNLEDCVYYGDALDKGGNDETVIGIMKTVAVRGPEDTFNHIKEILNKV